MYIFRDGFDIVLQNLTHTIHVYYVFLDGAKKIIGVTHFSIDLSSRKCIGASQVSIMFAVHGPHTKWPCGNHYMTVGCAADT